MGFKDFMYTEKGKITGSVLAAVLISAAVFVPTSIAIDRAIHGEEESNVNVSAFGYDDNVTSTGLRQDNWMEIDPTTMVDASGEKITSMEARLIQNENYFGAATDEELMGGVSSHDGIGYLSNSHVSKDGHLKPLSISEDGGETWIEPGNPDYIAAPLNMVMKVPQAVSAKLKEFLGKADEVTTPLTIADLNGLVNTKEVASIEGNGTIENGSTTYDYGTWLNNNGFAKDFALSFIAFNWIAQAQPAFDGIDGEYAPVNTAKYNDADEFKQWAVATFGGDQADTWGVITSAGEWNFTNEEILIDGSGTDEAAVNLALEAFEGSYGISIIQNLNNGGSFRAWETTDAGDLPAGVAFNPDEYDNKQNGSKGAFIGTQSRGMQTASMTSHPENLVSGEISYWGYDEESYISSDLSNNGVESSDMENIIYNFESFEGNADVPLATTIAADQVVFFTTVDAHFEHDGATYAPTGISQEGAKLIYQIGASWEEVYQLGFLDATEI